MAINVITEDRASGAQVIDGSLKFDGSGYLTRTPSSVGNRRTFTWSAWIKRSDLSSRSAVWGAGTTNGSGNPGGSMYFDSSSGTFRVVNGGGTVFSRVTSANLRDTGWYNIVAAIDTTQSTDSNRVTIYINGEEATVSGTLASENFQLDYNNTIIHAIGTRTDDGSLPSSIFNGYMSQVYLIDGQKLDASYFGFTDPLTNTWRPKKVDLSEITSGRVFVENTYTGGSVGSGVYNASLTGTRTAGSFSGDTFTATNAGWVITFDLNEYDSFTLSDVTAAGQSDETWYYSNDSTFASGVTGPNSGTIANGTWSTTVSGTKYRYLRLQNVPSITFSVVGNITNPQNAWGTNGFYLPMDGNFPVVEDKSGNGNTWTSVNFGSSNSIEKATGAFPILNTVNGGNVAIPGTRTDANASNLVLALPLVGIDDDVHHIVKGSGSEKSVTTNGNAHASSDQSNFYGGSFEFDGTGDYLSVADSDDFHYGSDDFTAECWVYPTASPNQPMLMGQWDGAGGGTGLSWAMQLSNNSSRYLRALISSNGSSVVFDMVSSVSLGLNKWNHCAFVRSGNTFTLYLNGHNVISTTNSSSLYNATNALTIGATSGNTQPFQGYLQDVRVYKGTAKYTQNFIPAATSPYILADTPSGVSGSSKLTKITDGAVSFDGNGDYLSTASSSDFTMGTGDFTVECFITKDDSGHTGIWQISSTSGGLQSTNYTQTLALGYQFDRWQLYAGGSQVDGASPPNNGSVRPRKWYHLAVVRNSGTTKLYVDGKEEISTSDTYDYTGTYMAIGGYYSTGYLLNGNISNLRVIKGTALYTSNFTPPTEPLTNVTNTKLLCCQSNTSANLAAVSPATFSNDGTVWSSSSTISSGSNAANKPLTNGFDGSISTAFEGDTSGATVTVPVSATISAGGVRVYAAVTSSNPLVVAIKNGSTTEETINTGSSGGKWYASSSYSGPITSLVISRTGRAPEFNAIEINGCVLVDGISGEAIQKVGDAVATNFNPFNTDINTVRGQETGYCTLNPLATGKAVMGSQRSNDVTFSDGNLKSTVGSPNNREVVGNIVVSSGKYYYEAMFDPGGSSDNSDGAGWVADSGLGVDNSTNGGFCMFARDNGSTVIGNGSSRTDETSGTHASFNRGDVMGCAIDLDSRIATWYKNGVKYSFAVDFSSRTNLDGQDFKPIVLNRLAGSVFVNFGQKPFKFPPPDGFRPLNATNTLPSTVIARPDQYFDTKLYTGTTESPRTISGLSMTPDMVWVKNRTDDSTGHYLFDTVRGDNQNIRSDGQFTQSDVSAAAHGIISTTGKNSFTVKDGSGSGNNVGSTGSDNYVAWCWKAGGNESTFNVDGAGYATAAAAGLSCTADLVGASIGTKQGFSIIRYQATSGETVAHGLSQQPGCMFMKNLDSTGDWNVYHRFGGDGDYLANNEVLNLNNGDPMSASGSNTFITGTSATTFTVGSSAIVQNGSDDFIAYIWHDVPGLQKFGHWKANNSTDGNFLNLGFRPGLIIAKQVSGSGSGNQWFMMDSKRNTINPINNIVDANRSDNERQATIYDLTSNGAKIRFAFGSNEHFIYMAWAETPTFNLYGAQADAR